PELLAANVTSLQKTKYLTPYFGLHRPKDFEKKAADYFNDLFDVPKKETVAAARAAYQAYDAYKEDIRHQGQVYTDYARAHNLPILVVAGRPYHADPEVNHGINDLITSFHFVLLTEDAVAYQEGYQSRKVLNQWTYHSRMYNAARYVVSQPDMQLIQLVSFGCGIDAITGDEVRSILEGGGKLYTQLKIDDINNLGAVKIRIRSLIAAIDAREGTEET
ncbi:MAG: acyl-CoA dehydratase activase-related protein, partial [Oscillospiraceae bacterium]